MTKKMMSCLCAGMMIIGFAEIQGAQLDDRGARQNMHDERLWDAVNRGHYRDAQEALAQGADINARLTNAQDLYNEIMVGRPGHFPMIPLNWRRTAGTTPLINASARGIAPIVRMLLQSKKCIIYSLLVSAALEEEHDFPPELCFSVFKHLYPVVDIDAQNIEGTTALMAAVEMGHTDVVRLLLDNHADVTRKNMHGATALLIAAQASEPEIIELLVEHGSDVNAQDNEGDTPLIMAASNTDCGLEVMPYLLMHGADIHHKDHKGYTAYTRTTCTARKALLLAHGAQ